MADDRIILPGFLVASLYKNTLVEIDEHQTKAPTVIPEMSESLLKDSNTMPGTQPAFLGGNKKQVGIVVNDGDGVYIADRDLTFLENILSACHLSLNDIAIMNTRTKNIVFAEVKDQLQLKYLLLFGVPPTNVKLPFEVPNFQVQQYAGCTIMVAPTLASMNSDNAAVKSVKRQLWESLKRCFNI